MRNKFKILIICGALATCSCVAAKKNLQVDKSKSELSAVTHSFDKSVQHDVNLTFIDTTVFIDADSVALSTYHAVTGYESIDTIWKQSEVISTGLKLKLKTRTRPNSKGKITDAEAEALRPADSIRVKQLSIHASSYHANKQNDISIHEKSAVIKKDLNSSKQAFKPGFTIAGIALITILVLAIIVFKKVTT
jgi:hypothetical protein